jgi:ATP-dependent protease ClpP protease subunit
MNTNWSAKNKSNMKKVLGKRSRENESEMPEELMQILNMIGSSKSSRRDSDANTYVIDNNIYFQDDITQDSISQLNKEIRLLQNDLLALSSNYEIDPPVIKLHITSYGGLIHAAFSAIDCIKASKIPIHTIVDGYAASAATLISICGDKRYINKNASMLIHQLRSGVWGKMSEIEDDYENLKKMHEQIKNIYEEHTLLKKKDITNILKHDLDWSAQECLDKGLVDEIL